MSREHQPRLAILRRKHVEARTGLSRSSIYEKVKSGSFPAPVHLGPKAVGWVEAEIEAWLLERIRASRSTAGTNPWMA